MPAATEVVGSTRQRRWLSRQEAHPLDPGPPPAGPPAPPVVVHRPATLRSRQQSAVKGDERRCKAVVATAFVNERKAENNNARRSITAKWKGRESEAAARSRQSLRMYDGRVHSPCW